MGPGLAPSSATARACIDLAVSPDGQGVALAFSNGEIDVWTTAEGRTWTSHRRIETLLATELRSAALNDSGVLVAASASGMVQSWAADGTTGPEFRAHQDWIWSVRFGPDNQALLTTSRDNTAAICSLDGTIRARLTGHTGTLARGVFARDGQTIATASTDHTIRLWSTTGALHAVLRGHLGQVWDVAFTENSAFVLSAGYDRQVRRWPVATSQLEASAAGLVHRPLTDEEAALLGDYEK